MRFNTNLIFVLFLLNNVCSAEEKSSLEIKPISILVSDAGEDPFDPEQSAQALFTLRDSFFCYPFRMNDKNEAVGDAIKAWKWSDDLRTLKLELHPDLKFHDGRPIDAKALEFALVRPYILTKGEAQPNFNVIGSELVKSGGTFKSGMINGIKVTGSLTVDISLKNADPDYLLHLSHLEHQIAPLDSYLADWSTFKGTPISCGDYKVVHSTPNKERIRLEKFKTQLSDAPDFIELWTYDFDKLPEKPDIMIGGLFNKAKMDQEFYRLVYEKDPSTVFTLHLNGQCPLTKFDNFRRAIDLALPREAVAKVRNEIPTRDLSPLGFDSYLNRPIVYDLKEAKRLWETLPKELRSKEFTFFVKTTYPGKYFEIIEQSFRSIGMNIRLIAKQKTKFEDGENDAVVLALGLKLLKSSQIEMFMHYDAQNKRPFPYPDFAQVKLQKLLDNYKAELNHDQRKLNAKAIASEVLEGNYIIPLTYGSTYIALSRRVADIGSPQSGINAKNIRLAKK